MTTIERPRPATSKESLLEAVERVRPVIEAHAARGEAERRLPREIVAALAAEGLFDMLQPAGYGGMELHPVIAMEVWEAVARIDGATAWNLEMTGTNVAMAGLFPADGAPAK
jgi:alkylation response protein AidB-like acyl-CoA dehydrogenase